MNVFRRELAMMRTSWIAWIVALCGVLLMYIALYPTFSSDAEVTKKLFENVPPAIRAALKIDVDTLLSFLGFFAFTFTNTTLIASLFAMHTGVSILSRESRNKTTDFLLTKPQSRTNIFMQKCGAGLLVVFVTWGVMTVAAFGLAKTFGAGDFSLGRFCLLMLTLLIVQMWFFACGVFTSQVMRRVKSTIPVTLAVVFGFFIVGMLGAILGDEKLRYLSPFQFFDYVKIAAGKGYEPVFSLIAAVSIVVMLVFTYRLYVTRDVKAAE